MRRSTLTILVLALGSTALAQSPAVDCATTRTEPRGAVPVRIPIEVSGNHVLLNACVGGRPVLFILDTGAPMNLIDIGVAREVGLTLGAPVMLGGAGASAVPGAMVHGGTIDVPGVAGANPIAIAFSMGRLKIAKGRPIAGLIGYPFIAKYVMAIDYVNRELRLYDRSAFTYAGTGAVVPIAIQGGHPNQGGHPMTQVTLTLKDGTTIPAKAVVDVGASGALLVTKPVVERYNLGARTAPTMAWGGGGVGGTATSRIGRVASVSIGSATLANVVTTMFGDSAGVLSDNRLSDVIVGGDILRRFTVFFDYSREQMVLEPHAGIAEAFEADMSGFRVEVDTLPPQIIVKEVNPKSPAAEAGVRVDDVILSVDGTRATIGMTESLRERLRREGERVELVLRRGEHTLTVRLVTRRQV